MDNVIIEKKEKIGYFACNSENYGLEILGEWFTDDVGDSIDTWLEWFEDRDELAETTESNATWLEKDWLPNGGCNVTFGSIVDLIQDNSPIFVPDPNRILIMPRENVIDLLKTWRELLKFQPDKIMIAEENGAYKMFAVQ